MNNDDETFQYLYKDYTISGLRYWNTDLWYGTVYKDGKPMYTEQSKDRHYLTAMLEQYVKDIVYSFGGY
jgi:hypothetical protein